MPDASDPAGGSGTADRAPVPPAATSHEPPAGPPNESLAALFGRFLRFGALAWGGPVAQIAMLKSELVERERWMSRERFQRVLAVYQALPGPEAHELCVYFGMLARGRTGAVVAGFGFMLPGLVLILLLSWAYVRFGLTSPVWRGAMLGCQGAVAALIVRAGWRIGRHALASTALWLLAAAVAASQFGAMNGIAALGAAGALHALLIRGRMGGAAMGSGSAALVVWPMLTAVGGAAGMTAVAAWRQLEPFGSPLLAAASAGSPTTLSLFVSGLKAGLLTFGGAYTAIPFVRADAVISGGWMSDAQFLDGLALSSVLPAPFVIFATFVGFLGGGLAGALALTAGVFLPAFSFTLLGHEHLERVVERPATHAFLDGVMAGVVGIIAATAVTVARQALVSSLAVVTFAAALVALARFQAPATVAWVMGAAALAGVLWGVG